MPPGYPSGHHDGWGVVAYRRGKKVFYVRSAKDASKDETYTRIVEKVEAKKPSITIAHFRKASVGGKGILNAHPFVFKNYSFCHNGSIFKSERILLNASSERRMRGTTDSERFFFYLLQLIEDGRHRGAAGIRGVIRSAIRMLREKFDYTAMNILFTDGKTLWALREVNVRNEFVRKKKLMDYYSLYFGLSHSNKVLVCSERISLSGVRWKNVPNHALLEIEPRKGICHLSRI